MQSETAVAKSSTRRVPELSLNSYISGTAAQKEAFISDFFNGLKDYGFIVLKDHPISDELLNRAYAQVKKFYELPVATKTQYALKDKGFQRGYTPFGQENAKGSPVKDLKEFWHVGREEGHRYGDQYPPNVLAR